MREERKRKTESKRLCGLWKRDGLGIWCDLVWGVWVLRSWGGGRVLVGVEGSSESWLRDECRAVSVKCRVLGVGCWVSGEKVRKWVGGRGMKEGGGGESG